jgi:hypothetical protein
MGECEAAGNGNCEQRQTDLQVFTDEPEDWNINNEG